MGNSIFDILDRSSQVRVNIPLSDRRVDPHYLNYVADDANDASVLAELLEELMSVLVEQRDPRVSEHPCRYKLPPMPVRPPGSRLEPAQWRSGEPGCRALLPSLVRWPSVWS